VSDNCPSPEMKILLSDNSLVMAKDIKIGMKVKTFHEDSLNYGDYEVIHHEIINSERLRIVFDHVDFICSYGHKFLIDNSWIKAKDLTVGQKIGEHIVESIEKYSFGPVVKLTIEDAHTYICEDLLSHNKISTTPTPTPTYSQILIYDSGTEYYTLNATSILGSPTLTKGASSLILAGTNNFGNDNGAFITNGNISISNRSQISVYYTYTDTSSSPPCCTTEASFLVALLNTSSYNDIAYSQSQNLKSQYATPINLSLSGVSGSYYVMIRFDDSKTNNESLSLSVSKIVIT
jgi:hypothetical protein